MVGMEMGVDEDRFKDEALETPLRPLGEGEGLDLGVKKVLGVDDLNRPRTSRTLGSCFSGESSDKKVSDMMSIC